MKPSDQMGEEDKALDEEFGALSSAWKKSVETTGGPRSAISRKIRLQARFELGEELKENWLLGPVPLVLLVLCVFFAVSMYVLMSLEMFSGKPGAVVREGTSVNELVVEDAGYISGWVRLSFRLRPSGYPRDIQVISKCLTPYKASQCGPGKQEYRELNGRLISAIEDKAIAVLKNQQFSQIPGRQEQTFTVRSVEKEDNR